MKLKREMDNRVLCFMWLLSLPTIMLLLTSHSLPAPHFFEPLCYTFKRLGSWEPKHPNGFHLLALLPGSLQGDA